MAKLTIKPGDTYDVLSGEEFGYHSRKMREGIVDDIVRGELRGIKSLRPPVTIAAIAGNTFTAFIPGPQPGYVWSVRRVSNYGIAAADVAAAILNVFRSSDASWQARNFLDQMQPNSAWQTSKNLFLQPDEALYVVGSGITAATTQVVFNAEVFEAPAEMVGKLI